MALQWIRRIFPLLFRDQMHPALLSLLILAVFPPPVFGNQGGKAEQEKPYYYLVFLPEHGENAFPPQRMLKLYSAPLMDQVSIESAAQEMELLYRKFLMEQQKGFVSAYCNRAADERTAWMERRRSEGEKERSRWENVQLRFERMLEYRLRQRLEKKDFQRAMEHRKTVRTLQTERRELVWKSWTRLFDELSRDQRKGKDSCSVPPPYTLLQPEEKLFEPFHLALYRFYASLPPDQRIGILLSLKSRI